MFILLLVIVSSASCLPSAAQESGTSRNVITVAGNGLVGFSGDGGAATNATLNVPAGMVIGADGTLYFGDTGNFRIRAIDSATGVILTVAGNGTLGDTGNDGPATNATMDAIYSLATDRARHRLYLPEIFGNWVRAVNLTNGVLTRYAGQGLFGLGSGGDGGLAVNAELALPQGAATDGAGRLLIADTLNNRIRQVDPVTGIITTLAGNGNTSYAGDGGLAMQASFEYAIRVAADAVGNVFAVDAIGTNYIVRRIDAGTGIITRVAGGGSDPSGTGIATNLYLGEVRDIAVDNLGRLYVANPERVFALDLANGLITPYAGDGTNGFAGDGGPALNARFNGIRGLAVVPGGGLLIADGDNERIRYVAPEGIQLADDDQQTAFYLPWVNALSGDLIVSGNANLTNVTASAVTNVQGVVNVSDNGSAFSIDLGAITVVGGSVDVSGNTNAASVDLGSVTTVGGTVNVSDNSTATSIDLSSLETVGGTLNVSSNSTATSINLGSVSSIGGSIDVSANADATSIDLGAVTTVDGSVDVSENASASSIDLSSLETVSGALNVSSNSSAASIGLGSVGSVGGSIDVSANGDATSVDLGGVTTAGGRSMSPTMPQPQASICPRLPPSVVV